MPIRTITFPTASSPAAIIPLPIRTIIQTHIQAIIWHRQAIHFPGFGLNLWTLDPELPHSTFQTISAIAIPQSGLMPPSSADDTISVDEKKKKHKKRWQLSQ
jgi:hypothetical protein